MRVGLWMHPTRAAALVWRGSSSAFARFFRDEHAVLIAMAVLVGIASGAAAGALLAWIELAVELLPEPQEVTDVWGYVALVSLPVGGGLVAGALHVVARRVLRQPLVCGVAGVIEAIARRDGAIAGRQAVLVGLGTGATIGSGGSCGYEAPSVAIGASVGSVLARLFGMPRRRRLAMVGAGCAGGLAAAFDAPLAGVIFAIEIVFRGSIGGAVGTMSMLLPLVVAAVTGTFTSHAIRGEHPAFEHTSHALPGPAELAVFALMGLLAGVVGTVMGRLVSATGRWFGARSWPTWISPAVGGLGVGLLAALASSAILGAGHATVAEALRGELLWTLAISLCVLKIVATALTLGSGGIGGVLMPSLYVGATLGTVFGAFAESQLGAPVQSPGAFAVVGMGAIFAATMHAPLTPIVVIFELTRDYAIMMPLMLSCILAAYVARRWKPDSLTHLELAERGVALARPPDADAMQRIRVRDIMRPAQGVLSDCASLEEVRRAVVGSELRGTFVVDANDVVLGFIDGNQLARHLLERQISATSNARELMRTRMALLFASDTAGGAMLASARSEMEVMPVVDEGRRLVGVVHRADLLTVYSDEVLENDATAEISVEGQAPESLLHLASDVAFERIIVGRACAGRSLAQLQLRNRTGCIALEWFRDEAARRLDPRAPLREGDVLALAERANNCIARA